uniref:ML domain-containing protein n=1 Tax=Macrostomum lignano TaxID=282301 RepID=A0A1I8FR58_9PLAT
STAGKIVSVDINPCRRCRASSSAALKLAQASPSNPRKRPPQSSPWCMASSVASRCLSRYHRDSNACNTMSPKCPLETGSQYVYTNQLEVLQSYPSLAVLVKWELIDPNSKGFAQLLTGTNFVDVGCGVSERRLLVGQFTQHYRQLVNELENCRMLNVLITAFNWLTCSIRLFRFAGFCSGSGFNRFWCLLVLECHLLEAAI